MLDLLLSLFVGWPAIVTTIILALIGLLKNNYRFLLAAAILAFPFSWFLSGFPILRSPIFLLPLLLFGSSFLMFRRHEMLAWIVAIPFFLTILFLYYLIRVQ